VCQSRLQSLCHQAPKFNVGVSPPVGAPKFVGIGYYSSTGSIVLHVNIADKVYSSVAEVCKRRKERGEAFLEVGEQSDHTTTVQGATFCSSFSHGRWCTLQRTPQKTKLKLPQFFCSLSSFWGVDFEHVTRWSGASVPKRPVALRRCLHFKNRVGFPSGRFTANNRGADTTAGRCHDAESQLWVFAWRQRSARKRSLFTTNQHASDAVVLKVPHGYFLCPRFVVNWETERQRLQASARTTVDIFIFLFSIESV